MKTLRIAGTYFLVFTIGLAGCQKKDSSGGGTDSGGGISMVNDPSVIGFSGFATVSYSYDISGRYDTERIQSSVVNVSSKTATNVIIKLTYSSGSGGTGTIYGSTGTSFGSINPGASASYDLTTDFNPNPLYSSGYWRKGEIIQAMVPASSSAASGQPVSSLNHIVFNQFVESKSGPDGLPETSTEIYLGN